MPAPCQCCALSCRCIWRRGEAYNDATGGELNPVFIRVGGAMVLIPSSVPAGIALTETDANTYINGKGRTAFKEETLYPEGGRTPDIGREAIPAAALTACADADGCALGYYMDESITGPEYPGTSTFYCTWPASTSVINDPAPTGDTFKYWARLFIYRAVTTEYATVYVEVWEQYYDASGPTTTMTLIDKGQHGFGKKYVHLSEFQDLAITLAPVATPAGAGNFPTITLSLDDDDWDIL